MKERSGKRSTSTIVLWYEDNKRWMPFLLTVFGVATIAVLMQVQALQNPVAFIGGLGWIVGYLGWGLGRPPEAPARPGRSPVWFVLVGLLVVSAARLCYVYVTTVYLGTPTLRTMLGKEGDVAHFELPHPKQRLVLVVHGAFQRDVGANAEGDYELVISRGRREVTVEGQLKRSTQRMRVRRNVRGASSVEFDYGKHDVPSLGPGRYAIEHLGVAETLRPRLRIAVYTTWDSWLVVGVGCAAFFLLAAFCDAVGSRAGHRTRGGSAVASAASFAIAFRIQATPDSLGSAVLVGLLASFLVGGGLGWVSDRIAKQVGGESTARRRKRDEDDEDEGDEPEAA